MPLSRRNQLLTDEVVQGELLFRAVTYWFFCLMVVSLLVVGWSMLSGPPRPFVVILQDSLVQFAPALLGSIVLLPIVLLDVVQVSSRFVGPIQRVRNVLRKAAAGEPSPTVALRKDDFWQDLAQYANQVVATQSIRAPFNAQPEAPAECANRIASGWSLKIAETVCDPTTHDSGNVL